MSQITIPTPLYGGQMSVDITLSKGDYIWLPHEIIEGRLEHKKVALERATTNMGNKIWMGRALFLGPEHRLNTSGKSKWFVSDELDRGLVVFSNLDPRFSSALRVLAKVKGCAYVEPEFMAEDSVRWSLFNEGKDVTHRKLTMGDLVEHNEQMKKELQALLDKKV